MSTIHEAYNHPGHPDFIFIDLGSMSSPLQARYHDFVHDLKPLLEKNRSAYITIYSGLEELAQDVVEECIEHLQFEIDIKLFSMRSGIPFTTFIEKYAPQHVKFNP